MKTAEEKRESLPGDFSTVTDPKTESTTLFVLLRSWRLLRRGGVPLLSTLLAVNIAIAIVVFPVIRWLFKEAARSAGMVAIDLHSLHLGRNVALTAVILLFLVAIAFWAAALQLLITALALRRAEAGLVAAGEGLVRDILRVLRKLFNISAWPLLVYLLLLLPLSGFGFTTLVAQRVAIPPFITGEFMKEPGVATAMHVALVVALYVNVRFALAIPIFALTRQSGGKAMRTSWRLTRGRRIFPLLVGIVAYLAAGAAATFLLVVVSLGPTALTDWLVPAASPFVAAYTVGAVHMLMLLLTSVVVAGIIGVAMSQARLLDPSLLNERVPVSEQRITREKVHQRSAAFMAAALLGGTVVLGISWTSVMQQLDSHPDTLVLGHRGFSDVGVENTIGGLEGANAAGVDLVEMDVMETKDGKFVVMHDTDLKRLAGENVKVGNLTLEELQQVTIHDKYGHEDTIPSLEDYVLRAAALDQRLLIEIKLGGADTEDHVDRLVAELEELGVADRNIYHSLDFDSVERLKELRPDLTVGYILPVAGLGIPETSADFVVVEEQSASLSLRDQAEDVGKGFLVWTVNDKESQRLWIHQGADGIITDHPDTAIVARTDIEEKQGMVSTLADILKSFVVVL